MGFPPGRIEAALKNTSGGLEEAIEWLELHQTQLENDTGSNEATEGDDLEESPESGEGTTSETAVNSAATAEPPKPLTAEERDAKFDELRQKAAKRKAEKEKEYKENEKKNEMIRRKRDHESARALEEIQRKEAFKEADRKRKEVKADALAKQRIRERIAADKEARRLAKLGSQASVSAAPKPGVATTPSRPKVSPTESKLRFRLQGQPPNAGFMKTFPLETTLGQVAESISEEVGIPATSIAFQTMFPTSTFDSSKFTKTLKETDLVNANILVKRL